MLKSLLSNEVFELLSERVDFGDVCEVRLRIGSPVVLNVKGINVCLKKNDGSFAIACREDIERVVSVASKHSLYTVENQIRQAFITAEKGYRIGISGEIVSEVYGNLKSIKNIYSVNIRVPHVVLNCSASVYKFLKGVDGVKSTLVISPPGAGKTTFLRDLCYQMSKEPRPQNILVIDERYEIAGVKNGVPTINVVAFCDIISGSTKEFGFEAGIRSLAPDCIITDEISGDRDIECVLSALKSGVRVIASAHSDSFEKITSNPNFQKLIEYRAFERYVVLSKLERMGKCEGIFDQSFKCIYS